MRPPPEAGAPLPSVYESLILGIRAKGGIFVFFVGRLCLHRRSQVTYRLGSGEVTTLWIEIRSPNDPARNCLYYYININIKNCYRLHIRIRPIIIWTIKTNEIKDA